MGRTYAALESGLLVVTGIDGRSDDHATDATVTLDDHAPECVAAHPDQPRRAFVGTFDAGLVRTLDGGLTWDRVGSDAITAPSVTAVAIRQDDPDVLWAGTEPSRLYRSTDGGDTWRAVEGLTDLSSAPEWSFPPRPDTHHVRWIEPDPAERGRAYVGIEAGAFVIVEDADGSPTFTERPPGARRDNHTLATHPDAPDRVYAAAGDGAAVSTDRGRSWTALDAGLDHGYVWGLAVDPGDPDRILVSAAAGARTAHTADRADTYCYRHDDDRWERLDHHSAPAGVGVTRPVLAGGTEEGDLFALSNRGLARSTDGGDTWTRIDIDWPDRFADDTARGLAVPL